MAFIKFKFEKDEEEEEMPIEIPLDFSKLSKIRIKKEKALPKEKTFVLNWEKELGFTGNPFKDEILAPVSDHIAGYEKERDKINLFIINNYKFGVVTGEHGSGKTIILKWLSEQLGEYEDKIIVRYLRGNRLTGNVSLIKTIVDPMLTLYDKRVEKIGTEVDIEKNTAVLRKKLGSKKLVLLIDDIHGISKENIASLNRMYATLNLQVVATSVKESQIPFETTGDFKEHLKIHLKGISLEDSEKMIKKRIGHFGGKGIEPFDEKHIGKIHKEADSNPHAILNLCQHYAIEASLKWRKKKAELEKKRAELEKKRQAELAEKGVESGAESSEEKPVLKPLEESERSKEYTIKAVDQSAGSVIVPAGGKETKKYVIKSKK